MFEWKVENMELMNEKNRFYIGKERIYHCENELSRDEKIAFVDSLQDNKLSYILQLVEKFNSEKESLPKDGYGNIKTVSLKAWLKRNDIRKLADINYNYGCIYMLRSKRFIEAFERKYAYDTYQNYVDELFHRQLVECERKELEYFREHDEYSILKTELVKATNKYRNISFGVYLGFSSNNDIYVYSEDGKHKRDITIDEINLLLSKYKLLDEYVKKLSNEVNIEF